MDSIASFHYGNWRALHHHAECITWSFCPPVSMVKDAMETIHTTCELVCSLRGTV